MYTGTHLFLASALRRLLAQDGLPSAAIPDAPYLSGAIRPDRWSRNLFRQHQYTADDRAIRIYNWLGQDSPTPPSPRQRQHELGVAMHYVQDGLDRSKKLSKAKQTLFRDLQHCVTLGLCELSLGNPSVNFTASSLQKVYRALSNGPGGIDYPCLEDDLDPSPDPERRYALDYAAYKAAWEHYVTLGYPPVVRRAFNDEGLMDRIRASCAAALPSIEGRGFQRSLRLQNQRVVYRELLPPPTPPRFWLSDGDPSVSNMAKVLRFFADDLGWILAFSRLLFLA